MNDPLGGDRGGASRTTRAGARTTGEMHRERLDALRHRVAFEDLLTRVASSFINRPAGDLRGGIDDALADLATFARVDRAWLYRMHDDRGTVEMVQGWHAPTVGSGAASGDEISQDRLTNFLTTLRRFEPVYLPSLGGDDDPWAAERLSLEPKGSRSVLAVPLTDEGRLVGFIGVDTVDVERMWSDEHIAALSSAAGIISQAMARGDAEQRFGLAFQRAPLGMTILSGTGYLIQVNRAFCELMQSSEQELLGVYCLDLIHPDDRRHVISQSRSLKEGKTDLSVVECRHLPASGEPVWTRVHTAAVRKASGGLVYTLSHIEDITVRRAQEAELAASEQRYRTLVENAPAVVVRFDRQHRMVYVSPAFEELAGIPVEQVVGQPGDILAPLGEAERWRASLQRVFDTGLRHDSEWEVPWGEDTFWFQSRAVPEFGEDGEVEHVLVLNTDITALKRSEAELVHQALHDPLTGLANRALLRDHLQHALVRARGGPSALALLFCDLDRFKLVNDSMGHQVGDAMLFAVAERLTGVVRPGDTVARLGGDEFVVLLEDVDALDPIAVADRIREVLTEPIVVEGTEVFTTVSIGIAVSSPGIDADGLLRDADAAMYLAKARGRDRYEIFDEHLRGTAAERLQLESALRRSFEAGELVVHYQPEIELVTGRIVGAEALARWYHPEQGLLEAGRFITLAEETGLITEVGTWVLAQACRQAGRWRVEEPDRPVMMRVNLSARQLAHPGLIDDVRRAVADGAIEAEMLCLEITETALMEDPDAALKVLCELHGLGVSLAVDDFGTGYSSLAYLKRFPVDVLKIDRSFVDGLGEEPEDTAIVTAIISLGRALGLRVVAEGVETPRQRAELEALGCDGAQGFLIARPGPPGRFWTAAPG